MDDETMTKQYFLIGDTSPVKIVTFSQMKYMYKKLIYKHELQFILRKIALRINTVLNKILLLLKDSQ